MAHLARRREVTSSPPSALSRKLRSIARSWLPPILHEAIVRVRRRLQGASRDRYVGDHWPDSSGEPGWEHESIVRAQVDKWPVFLRLTKGTGPLGINHESPHPSREEIGAHNLVMTFGYALALAGNSLPRVSVLDWGSGIGHYGPLAEALLPSHEVEYHAYDLPAFRGAAAGLSPSTRYPTLEEWRGRRYDLVLASGSLQYVAEWRLVLDDLARSARDYVLLTRLPVVSSTPSFVVGQLPLRAGYHARLHYWAFNRDQLLDQAGSAGLHLVREFLLYEIERVEGAPEQPQMRGFLLRRGRESAGANGS